MKAAKTETTTVRMEPAVKAGLKAMAERERRSLANMIEVMIRDYCGREGVEIGDDLPASRGQKG
ncbi:MAG: CopG family transcriptional regulator [Gammaproteobacteria bacterium]|nr:CopG family transcriptional regulator [Gammaproteobacteria bacterium]